MLGCFANCMLLLNVLGLVAAGGEGNGRNGLCEGGLERKAAGLGQTGAKGGFIEEALPSRLPEIVD